MPEIAIPMLLLDHIEPTEPANSLLGGLEPLAWKPLKRARETGRARERESEGERERVRAPESPYLLTGGAPPTTTTY